MRAPILETLVLKTLVRDALSAWGTVKVRENTQ
jgi:hypothetical protein